MGLFNGSTNDSNDLSDYYFDATISNRLTSRAFPTRCLLGMSRLSTPLPTSLRLIVSYGVGIIAWRGSHLAEWLLRKR